MPRQLRRTTASGSKSKRRIQRSCASRRERRRSDRHESRTACRGFRPQRLEIGGPVGDPASAPADTRHAGIEYRLAENHGLRCGHGGGHEAAMHCAGAAVESMASAWVKPARCCLDEAIQQRRPLPPFLGVPTRAAVGRCREGAEPPRPSRRCCHPRSPTPEPTAPVRRAPSRHPCSRVVARDQYDVRGGGSQSSLSTSREERRMIQATPKPPTVAVAPDQRAVGKARAGECVVAQVRAQPAGG